MIEQRVTLRYGAQQIPAIVQAVQGDTGRDVIFELADYEIPAGATANYYIDKPDGNAVYNSAEVISSTEILAHLTEQAVAEPGRNNGQVRILADGEVITSFDFVLEVKVFRGILRMQSGTEINIFDAAIQEAVDDAIEEIQAQTPVVTGMQNSIAPTYSSSSTYAVGDYVMYNAQLYRCVTAITTAEAWTATHWTQVPLANDVNDLKSAIDFNGLGDNIFSLGAVSTTTQNGLTITRISDNAITVNGTCSTAFNFNIASKAYAVNGGATSHYFVKTSYASFGTDVYVQVGWFNSSDVANNGKKISVSNEYVDITYADDAAKSREYIHFEANAVFDHVTFEFINTYDYPVDGILYELRNDVNTALNTGDQLTEDVAGIENALPQGNAFVTLTANYAFAYANQELSWTGDIVVIYAGTRNEITPANVGTQLGSAAVIDGSDVTVTIPQAQALIYRPADSTLKIVTRPNVKATDVLIFVDYYGVLYGNIITAITEQQLKSVQYGHIDDAFSASRATIILSGNGRFSIDGNNISYSATLYIDSSKRQTRISINAAAANAQLPDNSTLSSGTVTITVPSNQVLTYDYYGGSLAIKTRASVTKFDLLLFSDYYGVKSGAIYDKYWLDKFIDGDFASATDIFNAAPYEGTYNWQTPVVNFCKLFKSAGSTIDTFAFFTDPHIMGGADDARNEKKMQNYIKKLQTVYNSAPCDFIVGGGDWLNNSTSGNEACYRLGYIDGFMRSMFENYHAVVGNHDTNYQGTETLSNTAIANLWFRQTSTRKAYYKFKHNTAECYVLDSGIEHSTLTSYDYEQFNWFCNDLASSDPDHVIVFMHILTLSSQPMITTLGDIITAYNSRQSITINGTAHDFSACDGHIDFAVGGHTHQDSTGTIGGVPYFITGSNSYSSDVPLIDLVLVDYTARKIEIVRAGNVGAAREISF